MEKQITYISLNTNKEDRLKCNIGKQYDSFDNGFLAIRFESNNFFSLNILN